MQVVNIVKKAD